MRVGVISDTHGLLRPEAEERLRGVAHILHAGDIGRPGIVERLSEIAPVTAIRGNVDRDGWADAFPGEARIELAGHLVLMVHDRAALRAEQLSGGVGIVIFGHSHKPSVQHEDGVLYLNPGSAGPRRFRLPVTLALMELGPAAPRARIVELV